MVAGLWAILGILVGGFASRLASSLSEGQGLGSLDGRCPSCGAPVGLLTAGPALVRPVEACASCGVRLREPWPLGELAGALAFGVLAWHLDLGWPLVLYSAFAALLLLISLIDLRERLILDVLTYPAMAVALLASAFTAGPVTALIGGLIAGGLLLLFYVVATIIYRRGDALGFGDVKLAALIGLVVGGGSAFTAVIYGVLVGGAVAIVVLAMRRDRHMAIPYGPSLALGALLTVLLSPSVWR